MSSSLFFPNLFRSKLSQIRVARASSILANGVFYFVEIYRSRRIFFVHTHSLEGNCDFTLAERLMGDAIHGKSANITNTRDINSQFRIHRVTIASGWRLFFACFAYDICIRPFRWIHQILLDFWLYCLLFVFIRSIFFLIISVLFPPFFSFLHPFHSPRVTCSLHSLRLCTHVALSSRVRSMRDM